MANNLSSRPVKLPVYRLLTLIGIAALAWLGLDQLRTPACVYPVPENEFSCRLAQARIQTIANEPHPIGSKANEETRDFLLNELRMIGLSPQVQSAQVKDDSGQVWRVNNIVARLPGAQTGPAVMLACHYDSVFAGPGASDDGLAVGAMVETMRVLKAGPQLRNDVILLITDGEELGMLGAEGFVMSHPWAKDVGLVLNFDSRGTTGPSIMFQTSAANASLIRHFGSAAPYPVALSLAGDVYRHMPNDTDFTIFTRAGMKGLNFAFIDNYIYYHTPGDNLQHLDLDTLAHTGTYSVSLARHFGNIDLQPLIGGSETQDAVYFTAFRGVLIVYNQTWIWPFTLLLVMASIMAITYAFKKGWVSVGGIVESIIRLLIAIVASAAIVYLAVRIVNWIFQDRPQSITPAAIEISTTVFAVLTIIATLVAALLGRRKAGRNDLAAGGAIVWALIAIAVSILVPGGSYLAVWPALFALVGFLVTACGCLAPWARLLIVLLSSAPLLILMSPSIHLFLVALTYHCAYVVAPMITLTLWLLITSGAMEMLGVIKPLPPRSALP